MIVIDLANAAVVGQLLPPGVQPSANGSAVDMLNGDISTNLVLQSGVVANALTVKAQESDDGSTGWTDITGGSFTVSVTNTPATQVARVLRSKRYVRGNVSGTTTGSNVDLTVISQKKHVYAAADGNSGVDRSPSA